jgi:uncharacterized protein YyaL (SSP411 family)
MTNNDLHTLLALDRSRLPEDGGPDFNRLIFANSPYLLQHARNPVNWREWGDEAKAEAARRNLPLLVSIGYATCHWCHVMAHESFEDDEVADILNHAFVAVKVDREERPDLDEFCMAACQALTNSGGWPLNCFLKPDGTPFYAITYLPKEPRRGMPGFLELLENIAQVWQHKPDAVDRNAESLMEALRQINSAEADQTTVDLQLLAKGAEQALHKLYDKQFGGFGSAPKFPMPPYLLFLLGRKQPEQQMALATLKAMRAGGIWDQLGGGIHRYSTDRIWLVPHFEKMLYDQALVSYAALEAYSITKEAVYLEMAENLLEFVLQDMTSPDGCFYCGLDADSEGREGACYVWQKKEIAEILGDDGPLFCDHFGVTEAGNFEEPGENILYLARPETVIPANLATACKKLLAVRQRREQPLRDEKVLTAWNGMMIAALAKGAALTGNKRWLDAARKGISFIKQQLVSDNGRLMRSCMAGRSEVKGFLEDYACLGWGYLELFKADGKDEDLENAARVCREAINLFRRPDGLLLNSALDAEQMPVAIADHHDGVTPSGLAVLALNLTALHCLTKDDYWGDQLSALISRHQQLMQRQPVACLTLLQVALANTRSAL